MTCASTGTHTHCPLRTHVLYSFFYLAQVRSYIRVRDGIAHEVSSHSRCTSSGWTQHKRDQQAPSRTPEQREALRAKFARHRLPRK